MPSFCPSVREDGTQRGTHAASQGSRTHGIRIRHRRQQSPQCGQMLHPRDDVRREGKVQDRRLSALEGQRANAIIIWKPSEQAVVWNKRSIREERIRVESLLKAAGPCRNFNPATDGELSKSARESVFAAYFRKSGMLLDVFRKSGNGRSSTRCRKHRSNRRSRLGSKGIPSRQ